MSIKVICPNCNADFELKDELAGKKAKCPNCGSTIDIPTSNEDKSDNSTAEKGVFSHDIYGIKQKKIAINEKYFIKDKDNNDLLFSIRKIYFFRTLLSVLTFIFILFTGVYFLAGNLGVSDLAMLIPSMILLIVFALSMAIFVYPKKHITFHESAKDIKSEPEFEIKEDSKIQVINKTYTMLNKEKEVICKFRKNVFTNIFRKKWHMEFGDKHLEVKEDSILLGLLRRFLPFGRLIRTNFIFVDVKTEETIGIFKRKFEVFDNYSLDLTADTAYSAPRQLSIGMAVLLDTGEKR